MAKKIVAVQKFTGELIIDDDFINERMKQYPITPSFKQVQSETLLHYIQTHKQWSKDVFGSGERTEGIMKHIEKEIAEVREHPDDIMEYVDIIILAIDAAWRFGFSPDEIVSALIEKQNINRERKWPKTSDPNLPTEHID